MLLRQKKVYLLSYISYCDIFKLQIYLYVQITYINSIGRGTLLFYFFQSKELLN